MKNALILFLISVSVTISAQTPYDLFNSKSELFFNQPDINQELLGLKTDSAKVIGADTVYYHYRIIKQNLSGSCSANAQAPSWLGFKTIRNTNNDYIFFNEQYDSLIIKPSMPLNSSWTYFKYGNGDYIKATIASKQYEPTFDGLSDTVKTISFQAYNNLNATIANDYNSKTFKVAKTQGIIRLGNLYDFPTDTAINKRCYGKRLTINDLTDHNIGETIQIYNFNGIYNPAPPGFAKETYTTYTYLTKTNPTSNSVIYTASVTVQSRTLSMPTGTSTSTGTETITIDDLDSISISQMPQQYFDLYLAPGDYYGTKISYFYDPLINNNCYDNFRINYMDCILYVGTSDTCLGPSVSCQDPKYRTLLKGLHVYPGGYYESVYTGNQPNQPSYNSYPVYSNAVNNICGSLIVLGLKDHTAGNEFKLSPNPVNEKLNIVFSSYQQTFDIKIMDVYGKEIMTSNEQQINVSQLSQGLYFIKLKTDKGEFSGKFVKE